MFEDIGQVFPTFVMSTYSARMVWKSDFAVTWHKKNVYQHHTYTIDKLPFSQSLVYQWNGYLKYFQILNFQPLPWFMIRRYSKFIDSWIFSDHLFVLQTNFSTKCRTSEHTIFIYLVRKFRSAPLFGSQRWTLWVRVLRPRATKMCCNVLSKYSQRVTLLVLHMELQCKIVCVSCSYHIFLVVAHLRSWVSVGIYHGYSPMYLPGTKNYQCGWSIRMHRCYRHNHFNLENIHIKCEWDVAFY